MYKILLTVIFLVWLILSLNIIYTLLENKNKDDNNLKVSTVIISVIYTIINVSLFVNYITI